MQISPESKTEEKIHRYHCPGCGADLVFEPKDGQLACPYCGHTEQIATGDAASVQEHSYEEYLRPRPSQLAPLAQGALEVRCSSCGATVTFTPPEVARECDFCGAKIVAQPKSADPLIAPEGVLPFSIGQEQAAAAIKKWISSRWFAPGDLKRFATHDAISGVYLPYWTYDTFTSSYYEGQRGEHYYETETYTTTENGEQVTRERRVQRTRWYPASGNVTRWFDDVLIPATRSLPQNRLDQLQPWDLGELKTYEPGFLSGFKAQQYQVALDEGFEELKKVAARAIETDVRQDIGGDEQRVNNISTQYTAITFKHLLLPVYVGAYRLNNKVYQVVVNGRTGEVQGDRPYSIWKIMLFILFLLFLLGILVLILGQSR